jgi:hypothetical protein
VTSLAQQRLDMLKRLRTAESQFGLDPTMFYARRLQRLRGELNEIEDLMVEEAQEAYFAERDRRGAVLLRNAEMPKELVENLRALGIPDEVLRREGVPLGREPWEEVAGE